MQQDQTRRTFLKQSAALGAAGGAGTLFSQLAAIGEATAATASGYKAVVCVYLDGGNDPYNTLPPYDLPSYNIYNAARPQFAHSRASLAATVLNPVTPLAGGRQYALAPTMAPLLPVFDAGRMAVILNIGTALGTGPPLKSQYDIDEVVPQRLFSHVAQASYWLTLNHEYGTSYGWGGKLTGGPLTTISASTSTVFLEAQSTPQYVVGPDGPIPLLNNASTLFGSAGGVTALKSLIGTAGTHEMEKRLGTMGKRALDFYPSVSAALAAAPAANFPLFPSNNSLADQLKIVARLISVSQELGLNRQIFFVSLGGFDMHNQLAARHPALIGQVASAMRAFYDTTVALGISDKVTAFTASEFGRALNSNNDGSDNGWGNMHFVVGGAVNGRRFYGPPPAMGDDTPSDVGQGRLIPQIIVTDLISTLRRWLSGDVSYPSLGFL